MLLALASVVFLGSEQQTVELTTLATISADFHVPAEVLYKKHGMA
jgi:hypothetical protein